MLGRHSVGFKPASSQIPLRMILNEIHPSLRGRQVAGNSLTAKVLIVFQEIHRSTQIQENSQFPSAL